MLLSVVEVRMSDHLLHTCKEEEEKVIRICNCSFAMNDEKSRKMSANISSLKLGVIIIKSTIYIHPNINLNVWRVYASATALLRYYDAWSIWCPLANWYSFWYHHHLAQLKGDSRPSHAHVTNAIKHLNKSEEKWFFHWKKKKENGFYSWFFETIFTSHSCTLYILCYMRYCFFMKSIINKRF